MKTNKAMMTAGLMMAAMAVSQSVQAQTMNVQWSGDTTVITVDRPTRYLLLPVQENQNESRVLLDTGHDTDTWMDVRLTKDGADYFVPFALGQGQSAKVKILGLPKESLALHLMKLSDTFDTSKTDYYRPSYHFAPIYGWMNDPNGMVYKDGEYHLYFQYNPYGSMWGNMHWGHAVSRDLIHWEQLDPAIPRDTLGHIFSGSSVVDTRNTAGYGKDAIVALYTSASDKNGQIQCMAYSNDNGRTFNKYEGNPVLTPFDGLRDFRDPKVFWYAKGKCWYMIVSADKETRFYKSKNLKQWDYVSSFGKGMGQQPCQYECPDFFQLPVNGDPKNMKWVMIMNINPGCLFGGSATEYFVGDFDGKNFVCPDAQDAKWLDYGKDHYATVTFSNTGERVLAITWMSNWQYANQVPTQQYRSGNSIPRDLGLFEYKGETYCSVVPSPEMTAARSKKTSKKLSESCEMVVNLKGNATITLSNDKGEKVVMNYDAKAETFSMDRTKSGKMDFSSDFAATTKAPTYGKISQLRIFIDKSSIEVLDAEGKMAMTNLVFPSKPYNKVTIQGKGKYQVYNIK